MLSRGCEAWPPTYLPSALSLWGRLATCGRLSIGLPQPSGAANPGCSRPCSAGDLVAGSFTAPAAPLRKAPHAR